MFHCSKIDLKMFSFKPIFMLVVLFFSLINPVLSVTVRINALGDSITGSPVRSSTFDPVKGLH